MKNHIILLFALLFASQCMAQLGVIGGYKTFNPNDWNGQFQDGFNEAPYSMGGWQAGVDYWFRLKKRRIEFAPELTATRFHNNFESGELEHSQVGFHFNTAVYIFDLASDCNCPTFSKDGNFFSKGFFLEVSPGAIFLHNAQRLDNPTMEDTSGNEFAFGGSVGAGLDFGFSDLFTLTPIARFYFYPNVNWAHDLSPASLDSDLTQLFLGLRARLHFKEFAKARFR